MVTLYSRISLLFKQVCDVERVSYLLFPPPMIKQSSYHSESRKTELQRSCLANKISRLDTGR